MSVRDAGHFREDKVNVQLEGCVDLNNIEGEVHR